MAARSSMTCTALMTVLRTVRGLSVNVNATSVAARLAIPAFPAASRAVTVSVFVPTWSEIPLAVQLVVPVAVPLPPALFFRVTWVTPTVADGVPPGVSGELRVAVVEGGGGGGSGRRGGGGSGWRLR